MDKKRKMEKYLPIKKVGNTFVTRVQYAGLKPNGEANVQADKTLIFRKANLMDISNDTVKSTNAVPVTLSDWLARTYDILVNICGASEDMRDSFIQNHLDKNYPHEWRFIGKLGYGGKYWRTGRCYVTCYREDETDERLIIINRANIELEMLGAR